MIPSTTPNVILIHNTGVSNNILSISVICSSCKFVSDISMYPFEFKMCSTAVNIFYVLAYNEVEDLQSSLSCLFTSLLLVTLNCHIKILKSQLCN